MCSDLKKVIRICFLCFLIAVILSSGFSAFAVGDIENINSYIYSASGDPIAAPESYKYYTSITADTLGIEGELQIQELDIDNNDNIYLLDSKNSQVIIIDKNYNLLKIIKEFEYNGVINTFSSPMGLCVSKFGELYVADTENKRIVVFNQEGVCTAVLGKPEGEDVQIDYEYYPTKIQVDEFDNLYVIARDQTLGIMRITTDGKYCGYLGATKVIPNALQILLRQFATEEQLSGLMNFIPTEYSNMDIDSDGFLYCTVATLDVNEVVADIESNGSSASPIRKLNQDGKDILVRLGLFPPVGDIAFNTTGNVNYDGISSLVDIAVFQNDIYSALDSKRGRIFTYDSNGNLLYVFGNRSSNEGGFLSASAILYHGDRILVSDSKTGITQVFVPTDYAKTLHKALACFDSGDYKAEGEIWKSLLETYDGNTVIYTGIGRVNYNNGDYISALKAFKLAENKTYYSKALKAYIKELGSKYAPVIVAVIIILLVAIAIFVKIKKSRPVKEKEIPQFGIKKWLYSCKNGIKYSFYVACHPFDGFNDLKFEGRGNFSSAVVLCLGCVLANIFRLWLTPYLFNNVNLKQTNIIIEGTIGVLVPLLLWCVSNWCFTTLMDGKGSFKDIFIFSSNCLLPLIIIYPLLTVVSYFLYEGSASFANMITILALVWMLFLFVVGTITTHQYTLGKAIVAIILSVVGMLIIVFLTFLVIVLVQQVINFAVELFKELILSLG